MTRLLRTLRARWWLPRRSACGIKGVRFKDNKWIASIRRPGGKRYIGRFSDAEAARAAYAKAAMETFGEFARLA